jgi:mannitol operon transcriptional antiterminator
VNENHDDKTDMYVSYEAYKSFTGQSQLLIDLLEIMKAFQIDQSLKIEGILTHISEMLESDGLIHDRKELVKALLNRERIGGLAIPGTKLALFHTRSDAIARPSFHTIDLKTPMKLKAMDNEMINVNRILLLLAPEQADPNQLEIMSFISASIIETQESIRNFETAAKSSLIQYISQKYFTNFVQNLRSD